MRILVANDIDENLFLRNDTRAWSQRVFWFAEPGDLVIVPEAPDQLFVEHVAAVRELRLDTVDVSVAPQGRYGPKMIDMRALCAVDYLKTIRDRIAGNPDVEVFLLFPSIHADRFVKAIGGLAPPAGSSFFRQGGTNMCNSKAVFRALACDVVPLAEGDICYTKEEASLAIGDLLATGGAAVVKRAQGGGGVGNELLTSVGSLPPHIGVSTSRTLEAGDERALAEYLDERWDWATLNGRFPAVVEQFLDVCSSFTVEFELTDRVELVGVSTLEFEKNRNTREIFGAAPQAPNREHEFVHGGSLLAQRYHDVGYRGFVCFDAVLTRTGDVVFTEANARTATGTHVNVAFRRLLVADEPRRLVQVASHRDWGDLTSGQFLGIIGRYGLCFDPTTGRGVVMITPPLSDRPAGGFMYMIACRDAAEEAAYLEKLLGCIAAEKAS